jgi:hypothetical protein
MTEVEPTCIHCGSPLRANAPFCDACGHAIPNRPTHSARSTSNLHAAQPISSPQPAPGGGGHIVAAGRGVRCCSYLLDLAALLSPALPLAIAAVILQVSEVIYIVVPVAFIAAWIWMSLWRGLTGMSFGTGMLGLRTIRASDHRAPGFGAVVVRGLVFADTAGLAALPVVTGQTPQDGVHDRLSGITLIDITLGANPLGPRQQTALRKTLDRSLRKVSSPVPIGAAAQPYGTGRP